jgi:transcriptional antiterminator RfaH
MISSLHVPSIGDPWYAIHCKARKEFYAASTLKSTLGLTVFLPESKSRRQGVVQRSAFFPGYLFVQVDLQTISPSRINATPGVLRLVEFGGDPQPIPSCVIQTIIEKISWLDATTSRGHCTFQPGDILHVKDGPLQDLEMIFVRTTSSNKRVYVLMSLLGRLKEVPVDPEKLIKTSNNTGPQQGRHRQEEMFHNRLLA